MSKQETEDFVNDLIASIWDVLDAGVSVSEVRDAVENALSSWEPLPEVDNSFTKGAVSILMDDVTEEDCSTFGKGEHN